MSIHRRVAAHAVALGLVLGGRLGIAAGAEPKANGERDHSVAVASGLVALTLGVAAEFQTQWGPTIGVGAGYRRGPGVNGYLGYDVPVSAHWALRPGFRVARLRQETEACAGTCTFDFFFAEAAIRYRGASGFIFEYGLPLLAWVPVGPGVGETQPHLAFYTLATGETALLGTLLVGYAFDL